MKRLSRFECFQQILEDYCNNTTLHGYKYLVQNKRPKIEKFIWLTILTTTIIMAGYVCRLTLNDFQDKLTITALENTKHNVRNVPFPGIAICTVNKISRKHAATMSKEISTIINVSEEIVFDLIKWFGRLYDYGVEQFHNVYKLHKVLEQYNDAIGHRVSLLEILEKLTPSCEETIVKCYWLGQKVNCSQIIRTRRTMDGYCCSYNYVKSWKGNNFIKNTNDLYFSGAGIEEGLTVVVYSDPDDYYYPLISAEGLSVKVFNSHDYPDVSSGGLVESFLPLQHEIFIQISPTTVKALPSIKDVPIYKRGCVFENEGKTVFDTTFYSYSDCISDCKLKSILALCECVPFFLPVLDSYKFSKQFCSLSDVVCLHKYKEKWMNIFPPVVLEELDSERESSMFCPHCLPSCTSVSYSVDTDYVHLSNIENKYIKNLNLSKHSIIHIYADTEYTLLYQSDIFYYWFDIIGNFGSLCGLFMGFSLISIVEFIYFITVRFYFLIQKNNKL